MKVGDRVRVEFEGVVEDTGRDGVRVRPNDNNLSCWIRTEHCRVVIDDPSKDLIGTERQAPGGGVYFKSLTGFWLLLFGPPHLAGTGSTRLSSSEVVGWPIKLGAEE